MLIVNLYFVSLFPFKLLLIRSHHGIFSIKNDNNLYVSSIQKLCAKRSVEADPEALTSNVTVNVDPASVWMSWVIVYHIYLLWYLISSYPEPVRGAECGGWPWGYDLQRDGQPRSGLYTCLMGHQSTSQVSLDRINEIWIWISHKFLLREDFLF